MADTSITKYVIQDQSLEYTDGLQYVHGGNGMGTCTSIK